LLDEAACSNLSTRETLALLCEREIAMKDRGGNVALEPILSGRAIGLGPRLNRFRQLYGASR
jgi:hypothetical protein